MRTLDLELKKVIKDMPDAAIMELTGMIENEKYSQRGFSGSVYSGLIKQCVDAVRKKYNLEPTPEIDDDRAIDDIEDPIEQEVFKGRRVNISGKKLSVRSMPDYAIEKMTEKELLMRKGEKYLSMVKGKSVDDLIQMRQELHNKYLGVSANMLLDDEVQKRVHESDSEYGLNFYEKTDILSSVIAETQIRQQFSKMSKDEVKKKKDSLGTMRDESVKISSFTEMDDVFDRLGLDVDSEARSHITVADVAEMIESRELEVDKKKPKFNLFALVKNALFRKPTKDSQKDVENARNNARDTKDLSQGR